MNTLQDWPSRLLTVRRRLHLDQKQMGDRLGVTREWVSRLERGKGEFSDIVRLRIEEAEHEKEDHKSDHTPPHVFASDVPQAPYGTAESLAADVHRRIDYVLAAAKGEPSRINWIIEQMKEHLSPPKNWQVDEVANRKLLDEHRRSRATEQPEHSKRDPQSQRTAGSA